MDFDSLFGAILIPVLAATALLFAARVLRHRWSWCGSDALPGIALAGVLIAAFRHQSGGFPLPPHISFDWFPWGIAITIFVACVAGALQDRERPSVPLLCLGAACAAAAAFIVVAPAGLGTPSRIGGAAVAGISAAIATAALRTSGPSAAIGMWGSAAALSGLVLFSSIAKLAFILGAFSAMSAAIAVLSAIQRPLTIGMPAVAVFCAATAVSSMYGMGYDVSNIPSLAWWLAAASPAAAGIALIPAVARRPRICACVRAGGPMVVAAAALGIAVIGASPTQKPSPEYDAYGAR